MVAMNESAVIQIITEFNFLAKIVSGPGSSRVFKFLVSNL
jgi:hypothetical protein